MKNTEEKGKEKESLTYDELVYLCGFLQMRINDKSTTEQHERKTLKIILKKLRGLK